MAPKLTHGILLSSASLTTSDELITGSFRSAAEARARAEDITKAQPGIEYELMARPEPSKPWLSAAGGLSELEVISQRWSA